MAIIKQYVNLDPKKANQLDGLDPARAGKKVILEANVKPIAAGIAVVFEITRGANNLTRANQVTRRGATTDANGKARLSYELTEHGGDEFTVKVSLTRGLHAGKQIGGTDTYVVWRRFYYQMSRFDAGVLGADRSGSLPAVNAFDLAPLAAEFADRNHNIEFVDKSTSDLITRYANVLTHDNSSSDYKRSAKDGYVATRTPVAVRLVIVNQMSTAKTAQVTWSDVDKNVFETKAVPHYLWKDLTLDGKTDWLVKAEWCWAYDLIWHTLDEECVSKTGEKHICLDLAMTTFPTRTFSSLTEKIKVRVTYRYIAGQVNGSSWYNAVWLASSSMVGGARSASGMKQTAIHELGHFVDMVPSGQTTRYTGHGHTGRHCSTGLSAADLKKAKYSGLNGTCIMFGESGDARGEQFCAICDSSLRKRPIKRDGMPKSW